MYVPQRPLIKIGITPMEFFLEILSLVGILYLIVNFLESYSVISVILPLQVSASSTGGSLDPIPALLLFFAIFFYGLLTSIRIRYLHLVKYPWPITLNNAERQYGIMRTLLSFVKVEIIWILTVLALEAAIGLIMIAFEFVIFIILLVTLGYFMQRLSQAR